MCNGIYETTDFGVAAFAQNVKGCVVQAKKVARGRAKFVVHLNDQCTDGDDLLMEYLNSAFCTHDELVRKFKKSTY